MVPELNYRKPEGATAAGAKAGIAGAARSVMAIQFEDFYKSKQK